MNDQEEEEERGKLNHRSSKNKERIRQVKKLDNVLVSAKKRVLIQLEMSFTIDQCISQVVEQQTNTNKPNSIRYMKTFTMSVSHTLIHCVLFRRHLKYLTSRHIDQSNGQIQMRMSKSNKKKKSSSSFVHSLVKIIIYI